jgi:hypothetical protein
VQKLHQGKCTAVLYPPPVLDFLVLFYQEKSTEKKANAKMLCCLISLCQGKIQSNIVSFLRCSGVQPFLANFSAALICLCYFLCIKCIAIKNSKPGKVTTVQEVRISHQGSNVEATVFYSSIKACARMCCIIIHLNFLVLFLSREKVQ